MDTLVLERGRSNYLVNVARVVRSTADVSSDLAESVADDSWQIDKANPFITWIAGDFVEADNANSNTQFWTAGDLELSEYSIKYAPLNMVHKFRQPIGFYAATKVVKLDKKDAAATLQPKEDSGTLKIQALSGLWSHIFPFEATQVEAADDAGLLFYCVDPETEMLTLTGWKRYDQLKEGELVYTLDPYSGMAGWQPLSAINVFDYDGELVSFEGQQHSSLTTPNHRWLVRHQGNQRVDWRTSDKLSQACGIPRAVPQYGEGREAKFQDAFVELLAWFWTEGTIGRNSNITIYQSHARNQVNAHRIAAALKLLFGEQARVRDGGMWYATQHGGMTHFHLCKEASEPFLDIAPDKVVRPDFLAMLTQAQLRLYIETSIDADGSRARADGQTCISQTSEERIRSFEIACALAGIPTNTARSGDMWRCRLVRRSMYVYPKRNADLAKKGRRAGSTHELVPYQGKVWCPTTPNGTFLARRRGTVYWTGNSMECRGTHLTCGTDESKGLKGCGQTFDYMQVDTHCEHLLERSSVRHIVSPTFRGGAIIVPPVRPGWKNAHASVLEEAVMQEAASFAEQNERAYNQLTSDGTDISASAWEQLMALTIQAAR